MGKPQSFKDIFKSKKQVPFNHQDRLLSTPPPPRLSVEEGVRREKVKKELTKFCNALHCVVCGGQLDGPVNYEYAELYCVYDNKHFTCKYSAGQTQPDWTNAIYNFPDHAVGYQVTTSKQNDKTFSSWIYKLDLNLIERFRFRDRRCVLSLSKGSMIKFPKGLSFADFEQKIKVYTVFS